ncbi:TonB-dependent receptor [Eisenibacter elegans]|uniref:TonB-dependent receptor n=1 Tax=Eisenibacter elegans TaxID=997 RepID=UPI000426E2C1|nr:carboxypeptidase-like regulatory domain-containing protein [Eisenibacter elegans]
MKRVFYHLLLIAVVAFGFSFQAAAQGVTTSTITGYITDNNGEALPGATVIAIHEPSGTRYGTVTQADGRFLIPNARVGGPYSVTASYVGYTSQSAQGITLSLGNAANVDIKLADENTQLSAVEIVGSRNDLFNPDRTGASTNLDERTINSMPTISRSINDFTRLTPQSNGTSFAGRDNRFNNYTIDGNIYNNNFGLGSDQFAGGNPVSLDAIEEIQVNLAPYDVRNGGFTGANVNAITRSGTNEFKGSVYYYTRNQTFQGKKIGDNELVAQDFGQNIIGGRIGGPIIKNKLFFFLSAESDRETRPGQQNRALRPGLDPNAPNVTRVRAEDLDFIRSELQRLYGYDTGPYEGYDFGNNQLRLNARIDWNISDKHKLAVRFNRYSSSNDVFINGSSTSNVLPGGLGNRNSIQSMHFRNSNYTLDQATTSIVAELNSVLSNRVSNSLNIGYTIYRQERGIPGGQDFPFIEVVEGTQYYTALGNELFSVANILGNNTLNITNNTTVFLNKHTVTAGFNVEYMTFENAFNRFFNSVYRYGSYNDFVEAVIRQNPNVQPIGFIQGFAFGSDPNRPAVDETAFGQVGLYIQDEFQVNRNLRITAGLRVDGQFYPRQLDENPAIRDNFTFRDPRNGAPIIADVSKLPSIYPLWSPRIGFNWDVLGDNTLKVRGGTGIFTGRIPFVWISNQVNNNGVLRGFQAITTPAGFAANPRPFNPNVGAYRPANPTPSAPSGDLAITAEDFRFPQVWRSNLAVDYQLPWGIVATLEGIYTKDINNTLPLNVNQPAFDGRFEGADNRPFATQSRINAPFTQAIFLTNTNEGYYAAGTIQLQKTFDKGFYASLAYTRSVSKDQGISGAGGSTAGSLWTNNVQFDRNNPELSWTGVDQPNRVVGLVSYSKEYLKFGKTTISLFYDGGEQGRFSYLIGNNMAGDNGNRLIYVPNNPSEIIFRNITQGTGANQVVLFTAQQQSDAFFAYINQDPYLSSRRGQYAERNGALLPWLHRFDFRIVQDLFVNAGGKRNTIQFSLDILNVGNMLNSEWGVGRLTNAATLLAYAGRDAQNRPTYRLNRFQNELPTTTSRPNINLSQVWQMQFGVRYIFN